MFTLSSADGPVISPTYSETTLVVSSTLKHRDIVVRMLNAILSLELIGVVRHRRHHDMARDLCPQYTGYEFLERATDNQRHADMLVARIVEVGGMPDLSPTALYECYHTQRIEDTTLASLLAEDMIAQRDAIDSYRNLIKYLGSKDSTTSRVLAVILALEQQQCEFARKILNQCK